MISLEQNRERLARDLCGEFDPSGRRKPDADGRILGRVKEWLKDDRVRLDQSVDLLKVSGKILDRHVDELYSKAKQVADRRAAASLEDIKIKLEMVRDEESGFVVQRRSLRTLVEHLCDRIREHLIARMNSFVLTAAIDVIQKSVKPYIGAEVIRKDAQGKEVVDRAGLILELWLLREELSAINAEMLSRFESFEKVEEHLLYENLYRRGMFRNYYRIKQQEVEYPVGQKLEEMEGLFFQQIARVNPFDLRELLREQGREPLLDSLEDFCYRQFQQLDVKVNALDLFLETHSDKAERRRRLQRFVDNGSVWLQISTKAGNLRQLKANRADSALVSKSDATRANAKYKEIYDTVEELVRAADFRNLSFPVTNNSDAVFLYTEYAGIPLAYIRNLDRYYEEAYLPLVRRGTPLHTDTNEAKFTDILIKSSEEIDRTLRANRALLVGTILRTVSAAPNNGSEVSFSFRQLRDGVPNVKPLGGKGVAVETLKRDDVLLNSIETENVKRRAKLTPEARLKFFTLLAYHTLDEGNEYGFPVGPYAPSHRVTNQGVETYFTPECKALDEIRRQEYQQVKAAFGDDARVQEAFQRLYNTKEDFSQEVLIDNRRMRILKDGN
jgi:hypothetical protein